MPTRSSAARRRRLPRAPALRGTRRRAGAPRPRRRRRRPARRPGRRPGTGRPSATVTWQQPTPRRAMMMMAKKGPRIMTRKGLDRALARRALRPARRRRRRSRRARTLRRCVPPQRTPTQRQQLAARELRASARRPPASPQPAALRRLQRARRRRAASCAFRGGRAAGTLRPRLLMQQKRAPALRGRRRRQRARLRRPAARLRRAPPALKWRNTRVRTPPKRAFLFSKQ